MLCQQEQQRWWQNAASKGVRLDREGGAMLSTGSLRRRAIWETARKKWSRMDLKTSLKWISALLSRNKGPICCWAWPSGSRQSPWTKLCSGSLQPYLFYFHEIHSQCSQHLNSRFHVLMLREAIIPNDKIRRCWESTFLLSGDRTHWSPLTSCHQGSPSPKSQSNCLIILMIVKDHAIMVLPKRCSTTKRAKYPEGEKTSPSTRGWRLFAFTHGWAKDENSTERERQVPSRSGVQITSGPSHSGGFTRDETR